MTYITQTWLTKNNLHQKLGHTYTIFNIKW